MDHIVIDTEDHGLDATFGRGGNDHLLGAGSHVLTSPIRVAENPRALDHHIATEIPPGQCRWVALRTHRHGLPMNHKLAVLHAHFTREAAVNAVVLEQVSERIHAREVVDGNDVDALFGEELAERKTADAAESVDGNLGHGVRFAFRC